MKQATGERIHSGGRKPPHAFFREEGFAGVEKWLRFHRDRMVSCPHQPGNLKVTRDFCRRRRQVAGKVNDGPFPPFGLDDFQMMGLLTCGHCRDFQMGSVQKGGSGRQQGHFPCRKEVDHRS